MERETSGSSVVAAAYGISARRSHSDRCLTRLAEAALCLAISSKISEMSRRARSALTTFICRVASRRHPFRHPARCAAHRDLRYLAHKRALLVAHTINLAASSRDCSTLAAAARAASEFRGKDESQSVTLPPPRETVHWYPFSSSGAEVRCKGAGQRHCNPVHRPTSMEWNSCVLASAPS